MPRCAVPPSWATAGEDALLAAIGKQLQRDALELVDRLMAVGLAAVRRPWPGTTMGGEISANKFRFTQYRPGKGAGTRQSHAVRL